ncbi:MAG: hypothetical protein J1E34_06375 [Oscillospiraceae bacterium]|nr:hypothetical protein [Oscillospiraceae bacterium]
MKKLISVLLCIALLLCAVVPAFAEGTASADSSYNEYPLVIVRGMDFLGGLKYNPGTDEQRDLSAVVNISFGGIMAALGRVAVGYLTGGKDRAVDALIDYAYGIFKDYSCDENGDTLNPAVSSLSYPLNMSNYPEMLSEARYEKEEGLLHSAVDRYGAENVYYFKYDWRLDTLQNAALLDEMVELAKAEHNTDKVDMICCSMGGIVTLTYINYYGSASIDTLVSNASTMYGTDVTTDLFQGKVLFDEEAAYRFIADKLSGFKILANILYKTKIIKFVCDFLNNLANDYKTEIYNGVLTPVFGTMPAFWELCKHEEYESAKQFLLAGKAEEYAGLTAKTDKIQYEVVANAIGILDSAIDGGMKFAVLSGYNIPNIPAYESAYLQGDGTLETRMMSFGATVSEVGKGLPEESLNGEEKYISADKCINANTAVYKDYTWFVRDGSHVGCKYNSEYTYLVFLLLESASQPTVTTWEEYPQFLQADANENLSPLSYQGDNYVKSPC